MNINKVIAQTIITNHRKLGLKVPKGLATAADNVPRVREALQGLQVADTQIVAALADTILAGNDPTTDPNIARLLVARQIATFDAAGVENEAVHLLSVALRTHAQELIDMWRTAFTAAAETIATELPHLGRADLATDANAILNRGGDIATHFTAARNANETCELIRESMSSLGQATNLFRINKEGSWNLLVVAVGLDQWEKLELRKRRTAWELASLGLTLDLADPAEHRNRLAQWETTRARRAAADHARLTGRRTDMVA